MAQPYRESYLALAADAVVDAAACPVVLTDERRRVIGHNERAEAALANGNVLTLRGDALVPAAADQVQRFTHAHQLVAVGNSRVQHLVVNDTAARRKALLTIVRLSAEDSASARIGVLLAGPQFARVPHTEHLREALGITSAEVQLVMALCTGHTLRSYADKRGLSLHTVRTQLRDIYRKTGLRSQLELVRIALSYVV